MSFLNKLLGGFRSFVLGGEPATTEESRSSPRILCYYRVNLRNHGRDFKATIIDIGTTGMRVEGVPQLEKGERFELSYPFAEAFSQEHSFEVEVMWCRARGHDDELVAGVRFVEQGEGLAGTWVHTLLTELGLTGDLVYQKRQHVRLTTTQKVFFRDETTGRHILEGRVNNLSVGGALVESSTSLKAGRRVLALIGPNVNYPTLSIHAEVLNCRLDDEDDHHLLSLRFVELNKDQLRELESLVLAMLEGRTLA